MELQIADYARGEGISVQRARELARRGKINAKRVGRAWVVVDGRREVPGRRALSLQSQADLIEYLNTRSFKHVVERRRARLVERIQALQRSSDPASLLREYFAGSPQPTGFGGASIVRAATSGKDELVRDVFRKLMHRENLPTPEAVGRKIQDARLLHGLTVEEAASRSQMDTKAYRRLERRGEARLGNVTAIRALTAVGSPLPAVVRAKTLEMA
ncbi:hypothetical protein ACFWHR_12460 [Leucobacter sp. NPDC058333]|uniref:hypothetical protein n=1 Tax=Leucobacter sp. NPDC058333 TaxID=3346450 RepID=UPI00364E6D33